MEKTEIRAELEAERDACLRARDALADQVFQEGRLATRSELDTMGQLEDRANGYAELVITFFRPAEEPSPDPFEGVLY